MSLVEQLHAAHKARLARMSGIKVKPVQQEPPTEADLAPRPVWFSIEESPPPPDLLVEEVTRAVCRYFDISSTALKGERRTLNVVYPRQVAMFLARRYTTRSLPEIGRRLGGRDHTTVLHGARKIEGACRADWLVAFDVAHIEAAL
jgi:chromosomal replication initiation ATPase DnaA